MVLDEDLDAQKTCYFLSRSTDNQKRTYQPDNETDSVETLNKTKKERDIFDVEPEGIPIQDSSIPFVQLLGGSEPLETAKLRWDMYQEAWQTQQTKINELLYNTNLKVLDQIADFVNESWVADSEIRIPSAIIFPGSNISNHLRLFSQINRRLEQEKHIYLITLASRDCSNLKAVLRNIVSAILDDERNHIFEGAVPSFIKRQLKHNRTFRYDFDILVDWCINQVKLGRVNSITDLRIVISVQDSDSFDISILSQLIEMVHSYLDQVPFKLILSVATSLEIFQEKLPKSCIRLINGKRFDIETMDNFQQIADQTVFAFEATTILLGPKLFENIIQRQKTSTESVDPFISSLKYSYMSHYYSNPFSILTQITSEDNEAYEAFLKMHITQKHIAALRMLPSFKNFIEEKVKSGDFNGVKNLLELDEHVTSLIHVSVEDFREYAQNLISALKLVDFIQNTLSNVVQKKPMVELYLPAILGKLADSALLKELMVSFANSTAKDLLQVLDLLKFGDKFNKQLHEAFLEEFGDRLDIMAAEVKKAENAEIIADDLSMAARRHGTVQRESSKVFPGLIKEIVGIVSQYFFGCFTPYMNRLFWEVFVYDFSHLHQNVFVPHQRPAIENALLEPSHYLGSSYLNNKFGSDPHISILYSLYRESGVQINIYDWFMAFKDSLGKPKIIKTQSHDSSGKETLKAEGAIADSEIERMAKVTHYGTEEGLSIFEEYTEEEWSKITLCWFYQGVAELRLLGLIRDNRRKYECVEKVIWKGL
ncbi:hypothetical protein NADFUDRAFT_51006 [Nadsonia fulvescens var. elongata DSM 6958]|uniref:Uncharacterized protein n=1 Tax=Nadsonia fulvescens var. elongata DSM 6958 TaxID=857566 RepID=A0A1E3PJX7_9ASCO|nr:hypothetical protein NADFUDRAFT_51006 [Nadsonia fulvescens var. elongata DSM 6958]